MVESYQGSLATPGLKVWAITLHTFRAQVALNANCSWLKAEALRVHDAAPRLCKFNGGAEASRAIVHFSASHHVSFFKEDIATLTKT